MHKITEPILKTVRTLIVCSLLYKFERNYHNSYDYYYKLEKEEKEKNLKK